MVPRSIARNPNKTTEWVIDQAKSIVKAGGRDVGGCGGQRAYDLPGNRVIVAIPQEAVDRVAQRLMEECVEFPK